MSTSRRESVAECCRVGQFCPVGDRAVIEASWRELRVAVAAADGARAAAAVAGVAPEGLLQAAVPAAMTVLRAGATAPGWMRCSWHWATGPGWVIRSQWSP
jgi:hypothetical protein